MPDLQHLMQLTKLHADMVRLQQLSQLSALTNLEDLNVKVLGPSTGELPGGLPSQLRQLTALSLDLMGKGRDYTDGALGQDAAKLFQHLGSFTSLQHLSVCGDCPVQTGAFSSIQKLSQLTSLSLDLQWLMFDVASTHTWAGLPAVEKLELRRCVVHPEAVAAFTQLRALTVTYVARVGTTVDLVLAVSNLQQLAELHFTCSVITGPLIPAAVFTALTASTNLCSVELDIRRELVPHGCPLFKPGTTYPCLLSLNVDPDDTYVSAEADDRHWAPRSYIHMPEQQLQQLCTSCPALQNLAVGLCPSSLATSSAFHPLLQLSALTRLHMNASSTSDTAVQAVGVAAQLTWLRHLHMRLPQIKWLTDPKLLQLTALTALEFLQFTASTGILGKKFSRRNKVCCSLSLLLSCYVACKTCHFACVTVPCWF